MMNILFRLLISILALFQIFLVADNLQLAKEAYGQKDYQSAYGYYLQGADDGNDIAQYEVGRMLYYGIGTNKDVSTSKEWLEKSSLQNNANAQVQLGTIYYDGNGLFTLSDYKKALELFEKAVTNNHPDAYAMMGKMYRQGYGVKEDKKIAMDWLLKADAMGSNEAQFEIGMIFER